MRYPTNTRPTNSWSDLAGADVGIWGLGVEGMANLRKAVHLGAHVTLVDDNPAEGSGALATAAGGLEALARCAVVIKSPGISRYRREVAHLQEFGIPVTGGLGLWMQEADRQRVACITGTKGKSTTTSIAGHLLRHLGFRCFIGGNLGSPPWDPQAETDCDFWLIETSSFQATDLATAPPVVAVTSLHPDHLDWHGDVEAYYADKLSLCTLPGASVTISNREDPVIAAHRSLLGAHVRWVPDPDMSAEWATQLNLLGRHNVINAEIARAVLAELGVTQAADDDALGSAAAGFVRLTSRLQDIGTVGGRTFVDDSLSTNALSALAAVEAFPDRPVALIVGGFDRQIDYAPLAAGLRTRRVPLLVVGMPANGPRILEAVQAAAPGPHVRTRLAAGLGEATRKGYDWAGSGGVVLLSPAAPSFGIFHDYRDRARAFARAMLECDVMRRPM